MWIRVWEYDVRPSARAAFEQAYGPEGAWAQLFSTSEGFRGTELFVSSTRPDRYLTVDRFVDARAWDEFLAANGEAYQRLDAETEHLTAGERELAVGDVV
ncbi:antibiotic biosynthesis monooxygenase family protein [Nocardioides sp.]|uniref:antibiotic biosynthesis monooxygenase family protein n=1 Tax=Nocardioides sp. TaxID=35761 RepID=UPI002ED4C0E1